MNPDDLRYTAEHEWIAARAGDERLRIGITDYAQEALGDIVFVTLPAVGTELTAGQSFGEVESTKSVSDVYAPVAGTVTARNEALDAQPGDRQQRPVRRGLAGRDRARRRAPQRALSGDGLLDAAAYAALTGDAG